MKKNWKRPMIIDMNNQTVKSGTAAYGAERVLTCGGAVTTPGYMYLDISDACRSKNSMAPFNCAGINTTNGYVYVTSGASDVTIAQACS